MLAQGHAWLRFPAAFEVQFQAETLEPRRKLQMICALIGIVAMCVGSLNIAELIADKRAEAVRNVSLIVLISSLSLLIAWGMPKHWRRNWQSEALTVFSIGVVNASMIVHCMISRVDTTFTHTSAMVSTVLYACIAARVRFFWAMGSALASFVAYVALVRGATPQQELIVAAHIKLIALSYVFVLVANYSFEYRERRNWLLRQIERQQRDSLNETRERLHRLSIQDPLTGLFNRRQFDSELGTAWAAASLSGEPVAMLMIDVDFFKRYNDTYGHPAGDACLMQVSRVLTGVAQTHGATAARLGGEEFGLLLPGRTLDEAELIGAALCEGVQSARIEHRASSVAAHVTVSVGAAQLWPAQGGSKQTLVDAADAALYQAKENGRDRTCRASSVILVGSATAINAKAGGIQASIEDGSADSTAAGAQMPNLESAYASTLAGRFIRLRFPAVHEAAFREHNADQRRKHLVVMSVLGLAIYNMFNLSSRAMFPDVQSSMLMMQVWLSVTMAMLTTAAYALPLAPRWREAAFSLGTAVVGVTSAWILAQSQQLTAIAYSVCLVLIPMFAGVAARQPFWFTCVPSVITCVAVALLLHPVGTLQKLVFGDSVLMIATNTVFTLILAYTLEHGTRKEWLLSRIEQQQREELQTATRNLHQLSMLDPLTGICNRRQFESDFDRIWQESLQDGRPIAMLMIDVDFFKLYNDGYGHPVGDRCLKQVASTIAQLARESKAIGARLGGEEFGILLPDADAEQATALGESICAAVRQAGIEHRHSKVPGQAVVTVSIGGASLIAGQTTGRRTLLALADDALYQAKSGGRNRVAVLRATDQVAS